MRARSVIHVDGPEGVGKTAFIERLIEAKLATTACIRAERAPQGRLAFVSQTKHDAELKRYRRAGSSTVGSYRFEVQDWDKFYGLAIMQEYSTAVLIEGDCPISHVELRVFIAPPPLEGQGLLRRVQRNAYELRQIAHERLLQKFESSPDSAQLLEELGRPLRPPTPPSPAALLAMPTSQHWALAPRYEGIERAQLIVINARTDEERSASERLLPDIKRLRSDPEVFNDVIGHYGKKLPVTAVVADLSDLKDPGLKKAFAKIKRALKKHASW